MIGRLKGIIIDIEEDHLILEVNNIGYIIYCTNRVLSNFKVNDEAIIITHPYIKEDRFDLLGFLNKEEKKWFLKLNKINGVGVKMALSILSILTPNQICDAVITNSKKSLTMANGVGPKLASRIITELADKVAKNLKDSPLSNDGSINIIPNPNNSEHQNGLNSNISDAISALEGLGYDRISSYNLVKKISAENNNIKVEDLIKESLKQLSKL